MSCRICQGKVRKGSRCMFCGLRGVAAKSGPPARKTKEERDAEERAKFTEYCFDQELKYLKQTRSKLIAFCMTTTGCPELDAKIIEHFGDWR